jgi:glucose/arabinose dehydrogenase
VLEYPAGFDCKVVATGFTAPVALTWDTDGTQFVAEAGIEGDEPRIYAIKPDQSLAVIYPANRRIPFSPVQPGFQIYGPVGGMVCHEHKIYVSHRDKDGRGMITAFGLDGSHKTIVADLPTQGDFGLTDLAVFRDRLYFGIGSSTNSGVVGLDNIRWLRKSRNVCDWPYQDLELLGLRFTTKNPFAGLFGGSDIVPTGPYQPFGNSNLAHIRRTPTGKPNGAICSVALTGGDFVVEAFGLHLPRGLAFNEYNWLLVSNDGMEMRGSRPVKDDPDVIVRVIHGGPAAWYGFPDYTADMNPVTDNRYQPPIEMVLATGFPKITFLIDHDASDLRPPTASTFLKAKFQSLSGAGKMEVGPTSGPFSKWRNDLFVTLSGDRAPYATSGRPLVGPVGYKVVRVNVDTGKVEDFIHNVNFLPASKGGRGTGAIERPIDVKIGPDGAMYVLDFGQVEYKTDGREKIARATGKLYKIMATATAGATTRP